MVKSGAAHRDHAEAERHARVRVAYAAARADDLISIGIGGGPIRRYVGQGRRVRKMAGGVAW
jgi:hypothetical protein